MAELQKFFEKIKNLFDSTRIRCMTVGIVSFFIILSFFLISVLWTKNPADANRGGAIVVAMSFYFLLRSGHIIGSYVPDKGRVYVEKLLDRETKVLLSIMSIMGTISWGFLDIFAIFFIS